MLSKRRKKRQLIRDATDSKSHTARRAGHGKDKGPGSGGDYSAVYREKLRKFRLSVTVASFSLVFLWWLPLIGPMLAGFITGRVAGRKWEAVKAMLIPALVIAAIVNAISLGLLPSYDVAYGTGQFFLAVAPSLYHASAPSIIPVVQASSFVHGVLAVGANGYLIISLIMAYLSGVMAERKAQTVPAGKNYPKTSKSTSQEPEGGHESGASGKGRYLYRKQHGDRTGFDEVATRVRKIAASARHSLGPSGSASSHRAPIARASIDIPIGQNKVGWVRTERKAGDKAEGHGREKEGEIDGREGTAQPSGTGARAQSMYTQRKTTQFEAGHQPAHPSAVRKRTVSGGSMSSPGKARISTILPEEETGIEGVDAVRRTPCQQKSPMNRAIIDRAVKAYHSEATEKKGASSRGEPDCQMGSSYRQRGYDTL